MRALWNRFAVEWCRTFHPEPSWPVHGHYHCPACLRTYPVPWQEGTGSTRRALAPGRGAAPNPGFVAFAFPKTARRGPSYGISCFRQDRGARAGN